MSHPEYENIGNTDPVNRVIEEVGELLQAIGKARRFGWFSYHPSDPLTDNLSMVLSELDDCEKQFGRLKTSLRELKETKENNG